MGIKEELEKMGIGVNIEKYKCPYCEDKLVIVTEYDLCYEGTIINPIEIQYKVSKGMQEHIKKKHSNREVPWQYKLYYERPFWIDIPTNKRTFLGL